MLERRVDGGYQARVAYSPDEVCPAPRGFFFVGSFCDMMFTHVGLHVYGGAYPVSFRVSLGLDASLRRECVCFFQCY